jgi:hypothetical protein
MAITLLLVQSVGAQESVLYRFQGSPDGAWPRGGLIAGTNGVLYGTTFLGGVNDPQALLGRGTVFALSPPAVGETQWTEAVLYRFRGNHGYPTGGMIADANGVLYGTTAGFTRYVHGTVFALSPPAAGETRWTEAVLYRFQDVPDGHSPSGGLLAGANGVLYGTTTSGGVNHNSTVFALSPPAAGEMR